MAKKQQEPTHENYLHCKEIFVPWSRAAAFIAGFIVIITATAIGISKHESAQDEAIHDATTNNQSIHNDLDTIKAILRQQ